MLRVYYCDCGQKMKVPEHALGRSGKCVKCGQPVTVTLKNTQPYDVKPANGLSVESLRTVSSKAVASVEDDQIHFLCLKCSMSLSFPLSSCGDSDKCTSCGFGFRVPHAPDYYKALLSAACTGLSKAWDLQATGEDERAQKGFDLAEECVREVLEDSFLPPPIEADALCLQGMLQKSVGHFAQAQTSFEKGLALGQANGFAMDLDQGWLYADTLADVYGATLLSAVNEDRFDEAEAIASNLKSIIKYLRVRSTEDSALLKHDSARLVSKGIIAIHHSEFDLALRLFRRVTDGPHKEYLLSNNQGKFRWLLGLAYMDIGQIELRVFYRVDEAIRVLQEALQCFSKDDEQFSSVQALLAEARSEPQLPATLKEKLNAVRSGDCETRVAAIKMMLQSDDLAPLRQYLPAVKSAVLQAMRQGDSRVQNCGALLLAELGDESDAIVKVLIHQLSLPQSEHETRDSVLAYKTQALFGLCHLRNRNDFVNDIITAAEHDDDETVRERAIFALAAIGHEAAVRFVTRLAADGNDAAVFALDCAKKDVEWLRTAVLCGREKVPGAVLSTYGNGWNGLRWGATVDEFRRRFPGATFDANKWRTGQGKEDIAGMAMMTGYMFNKRGQFELVGFDPGPGETVFPDPLFDTFGTPDGLRGTSWSYGTLVLKCTEAVIVLVNTAFSDDPVASWEGWTGKSTSAQKQASNLQSINPELSRSHAQNNRPVTRAGATVQALKLKLAWNTVKSAFLQLYHPLRMKRETLSPDTWIRLGVVPPAGAFLLGVVLIFLARGEAGQIIMGAATTMLCAAFLYVIGYLYISFVGPSSQVAQQLLVVIPAQRQALRTKLTGAQEKQDETYALKLEQEADSFLQKSRGLGGAYRFVWGAVLSLNDGELSPEECIRYCQLAFKLGWVAVKSIDAFKSQEQYYSENIGGFGGNYTEEQIIHCAKMFAVCDEDLLKNAAANFLTNNSSARNAVNGIADLFIQERVFNRDVVDSRVQTLYCLGYIAAKSPERLPHYLNMLMHRPSV